LRKRRRCPPVDEFDYETLEAEQLAGLVKGFRSSPARFPLVCTLVWTSFRRNEALALWVTDLDAAKKTLRMDRAVGETKEHGRRFKGQKKDAHKRTIQIDEDLVLSCSPRSTSSSAWLPAFPMPPTSTSRATLATARRRPS